MIGYVILRNGHIEGKLGKAYSYVFAGNGLFVTCSNAALSARIQIGAHEIRGLTECFSGTVLFNGKIPLRLFNLALDACLWCLAEEKYFAITFEDGEYHLRQPEQTGSKAGVTYETLDNVVLDLHTHGNMPAWFSGTDNQDEQGLKIYSVLGNMTRRPQIRLRVGVYGYFQEVKFEDVFDGPCPIAEEDEDV